MREYDEPLRKELAAMVSEAAVEQGWSFVGPVEVTFSEENDLPTGTFRVRGAVVAGEVAAAAALRRTAAAEAPHLIEGDREHPARAGPASSAAAGTPTSSSPTSAPPASTRRSAS